MGKAGRALRQVLEHYNITQNRLAVMMGIDRSNISRWVSGERDPLAEAVPDIRAGLAKLNPDAADEFVKMYLYGAGKDDDRG
ncbi:helix-turn-helix domain-containing protein [Egbenema bharatensis]|uniref:helix-turn-helix domain-containing protein n=1 Tax=Egbenema bharatensis TaxID=3463334 RepID=UPI003A87A169